MPKLRSAFVKASYYSPAILARVWLWAQASSRVALGVEMR